jgi:hypothetical protein
MVVFPPERDKNRGALALVEDPPLAGRERVGVRVISFTRILEPLNPRILSFCYNSSGPAIRPRTADAAATYGLAR